MNDANHLSAHDIRRICVEASVGEKSVRRYLSRGDGTGKSVVDGRIREAVARLGLGVPGHAA